MVDGKRVKKKLPGLLIDGATTDPEEWNKWRKKNSRINQLERNNKMKYTTLMGKLTGALEDIDKALYDELREAFPKKKR